MRARLIFVAVIALAGCTASSGFNDPAQRDCITTATIAGEAAKTRSFQCFDRMKTMRFANSEAAENYRAGCATIATQGEEMDAIVSRLKSTLGISFAVSSELIEAEVSRITSEQGALEATIEDAKVCAAKF